MEPVEVSVGDAVTLTCRILGTPDISVAWFKSDGKLRKSNTCSLDFCDGVATLKLPKTTIFDNGEYVCKAENRVGSASASCLVGVKGDARFPFFSPVCRCCCASRFKDAFDGYHVKVFLSIVLRLTRAACHPEPSGTFD